MGTKATSTMAPKSARATVRTPVRKAAAKAAVAASKKTGRQLASAAASRAPFNPRAPKVCDVVGQRLVGGHLLEKGCGIDSETAGEMDQHDHGGVFAAAFDVIEVRPPDARAFGKFSLGQPCAGAVFTDRGAEGVEDHRAVVSSGHVSLRPEALPIGYTAGGGRTVLRTRHHR